jgi:transposase
VIRIHLPQAKADRLEQAFRKATDRELRDRLQIVLVAHRGRPHQDIAADLAVSISTVQRWLNAYLERGLDGLKPRKARKKPPVIPAHLASEIHRWVIEGSVEQGLDRANRTHAELADHLKRRPSGSGPAARPCSGSAAGTASAPTALRTATCGATQSSRHMPPRNSPTCGPRPRPAS